MKHTSSASTEARAGRRVAEFCRAVGIGRSTLYALPKEQRPKSVKLGRSTIVVESPEAWLKRMGVENDRGFGNA